MKEPKPALSYDDGLPRISWRSKEDIYYFVTSSIHPSKGIQVNCKFDCKNHYYHINAY